MRREVPDKRSECLPLHHGAEMKKLKHLLKTSAIGRVVLMPYRMRVALRYYAASIARIPVWLVTSREYTNFTYDLDDLNRDYLAWFVAVICRIRVGTIRTYMAELQNDRDLETHVRQLTGSSEFMHVSDPHPRYARRAGWYALVRALKPKVVVESGVDKGLGSCVLASALGRNEKEGQPGCLYGIDVDPNAGYLFKAPYTDYGRILYGDSLSVLRDFRHSIDLFIHDSRHSPEHERSEFELIASQLAPGAVVLSDNAHSTGELMAFAERTSRQFLFFQERPSSHWYPGGGIGAALPEHRGP